MLLSIDRVLQLLSEEKTVGEIALLAKCDKDLVIKIIKDAKNILHKYEKEKSRKKIIIKKKSVEIEDSKAEEIAKLFSGSELSAIPVESSLDFYTAIVKNPENRGFGLGIIIHNENEQQIGKISTIVSEKKETVANFHSILKAMLIAEYFKTKNVRVLNSSENIIKKINDEIAVEEKEEIDLLNLIKKLTKRFATCKFEYIRKSFNEKSFVTAERRFHKNNIDER